MAEYFQYGEKEIGYLKRVDKRLAAVIDQVGMIERAINPDLFSALVHSIIGQQISTKAHQTIWKRMQNELGEIIPSVIDNLPLKKLQKFGITFKKAGYIKSVARKVATNEFDINSLHSLSDEEVCAKLSELNGIGVWTVEMLMLFSMQRLNVLSYGDLAILRGLRMVYRHRVIDKAKFNKYRKRYSPYASVASLYLWAVAGGAIEGMEDSAPKKKKS
jgi:DNA-3-methyladenine glycosylase II